MLTLTLCMSLAEKRRESHVCTSRGCDIIILYMHHAGAGFSEGRGPNIPAHCWMPCTVLRRDLVPTTMISRSTSRRVQKNTVKISAPHVHTHHPTNPTRCFFPRLTAAGPPPPAAMGSSPAAAAAKYYAIFHIFHILCDG